MDKFLLRLCTVDTLLEDRLRIDLLEFGLEILETSGVAAAIGTATWICQSESTICYFFTFDTPRINCSQLLNNPVLVY